MRKRSGDNYIVKNCPNGSASINRTLLPLRASPTPRLTRNKNSFAHRVFLLFLGAKLLADILTPALLTDAESAPCEMNLTKSLETLYLQASLSLVI
jgi:hypothetical protein